MACTLRCRTFLVRPQLTDHRLPTQDAKGPRLLWLGPPCQVTAAELLTEHALTIDQRTPGLGVKEQWRTGAGDTSATVHRAGIEANVHRACVGHPTEVLGVEPNGQLAPTASRQSRLITGTGVLALVGAPVADALHADQVVHLVVVELPQDDRGRIELPCLAV